MTIKDNLNQKELIAEISKFGVDSKTAQKEIFETVKNGYLWFRVGVAIATYDARKRKKWRLTYR